MLKGYWVLKFLRILAATTIVVQFVALIHALEGRHGFDEWIQVLARGYWPIMPAATVWVLTLIVERMPLPRQADDDKSMILAEKTESGDECGQAIAARRW